MRVRGDIEVKLFQHAGFSGKMVEFEAGDHDIDELKAEGFNDQVSSVIVKAD